MKKWTTLLVIATLALGLAACNETATPTENTDVSETSKLTLQEVYDKSLKVSEELISVKAAVDAKQHMQVPAQGLNLEMSSKMDMNMILEPMQIHQKGTITNHSTIEGMEDQTTNSESYITADASYMYEGNTEQWMKYPQDMMEQLLSSTEQSDPSGQLKQIESYLEDFTFEQDNDNYILSLDASGEKFTQLVKDQIDQGMQGVLEGEEDKDFIIDSVNYLIHVDKKSFQTSKVDMIIDMAMNIEGEEIIVYLDLKMYFSDFNELSEINIPQEVIDNAIGI